MHSFVYRMFLVYLGDDVFPIPGTKSAARILENIGACAIQLTPEEVQEINDSVPPALGDRYMNNAGTFNTRL